MKKPIQFISNFNHFIRDTEIGRRLKKNGERIKPQTIQNYKYVQNNLVEFCERKEFDLRICDASKLTKREFISEKNYWKKFYKNYTDFLYKRGCHDNYVGSNVKVIRTFFNYLRKEKNFPTGDFHLQFYVRNEEVDVLVLTPEQLKFLIHDTDFNEKLPKHLKRIKDIFVFGCTTGLRFSDIFLLTNKNFEKLSEDWYVKIRSQKTKTFSQIKLPNYAVDIFLNYKSKSNRVPLFKKISLFNFNKHLKSIGKVASFDTPIQYTREKRGKRYAIKNEVLFYEKMSSHMMRRTAITTLLILGMPEHLVRNISGHSPSSSAFNRYVHYAQSYIDKEIDKVHEKLEAYSV